MHNQVVYSLKSPSSLVQKVGHQNLCFRLWYQRLQRGKLHRSLKVKVTSQLSGWKLLQQTLARGFRNMSDHIVDGGVHILYWLKVSQRSAWCLKDSNVAKWVQHLDKIDTAVLSSMYNIKLPEQIPFFQVWRQTRRCQNLPLHPHDLWIRRF